MDNLEILVKAILSLKDTKASKDQIASELPKLESQLQSDKNTRIKIVAGLDIAKSKNLIQSQLNTLANQAKAPAIKIGVDTSGLNGTTQNISNNLKNVQTQAQQTVNSIKQLETEMLSNNISDTMFNKLIKDMNISKQVTDEYKSSLKSLLSELKSAWNNNDVEKYDSTLSKVINTLNNGQKQAKLFRYDSEKAAKAIEELKVYQDSIGANLFGLSSQKKHKLFIDDGFKKELELEIGSAKELKSLLNSIYGLGNWTYNSKNQSKGFEDLRNYIDKSSASLSQFETLFEGFNRKNYGNNNFAGFFKDITDKIKNLKYLLNTKITNIDAMYNSADASVVNKSLEDTIAKIIELKGYSDRIRIGDSWFDEIISESDIANSKINEVVNTAQRASSTLSSKSNKNYFSNSFEILNDIKYFNQEENAIRSLEQTFKSLGATVTSTERKSSDGFIQSFTVSVKSATGEIEKFNYKWKNLNSGIAGAEEDWRYALTNINATDKGVQRLITSSQIAKDKLNAMADIMQQKLSSTYMGFSNGSKPIANTEHWTELAKQASVAENAIERLRTADSTTSASIKANAEIEIQKLKDLARSYQNAEYAANSLRTKGVTTTKKIETDELNRFINKINDSNVPINKLRRHIEILKSSLSNVTDSQSLVKYLDNFSRVEAKFNSLKALYQTIGGYDKQLDKLAKDWQKQGVYVGNLKNTVESLKLSLANVKTSDGLTSWIKDFNVQIGSISQLPLKIAESRTQLDSIKQIWNEFQGNSNIVSNLNKELGKMGTRLGRIKSEKGLAKWSEDLRKINSQVLGLINSLNKQVDAQNNINNIQSKIAKLNPTKDSAEISRLNEKLVLEQKTLSNLQMQSNVYSNLISFEQQEKYITEQTVKSREKLLSATNAGIKQYQTTITKAITELQGIANSTVFRNNASNPQVTQTKQEINSLITAYQNLATKLQGNITPTGLETVRTELTQLNARFNDATTTAKIFETELRNDNGAEKLAQRIELLKAQLTALEKASPKALKKFGNEINSLMATLNSNPDAKAVDQVAKSVQLLRREINNAGLAGKTLFQTIGEKSKKFLGWMSITFLYSSMFRAFRSAITNVIELDKAMTNLKKVTDETDASYSKFLNNASIQAKELHSTISDLVEQTAVWAKLGYSLNEAQNLATTSMIYSKVGEVENSKSVSDLVTVMKAFNIESEKSIRIVDALNELGNNFATSASDLGEGLTKSASALQVANNSFEQSIALLTGGTEITQNANEMGSALKVISMRIRGMKGALQELGEEYDNVESISKIQTQILNLTKGKVNIFDDNGNFRATYDILKDISDVYNDLSDPTKADITEILFGKMRGNQGVALIQAFQSGQIQKAYETALNSAGSAQKEFDSWSQSIDAHINTFKASFESLSKSILENNFLIGLVDSGTKLVDIIDKIINDFGVFSTLIGGSALFAGLKNVGELLNTPVYAQPQLICA